MAGPLSGQSRMTRNGHSVGIRRDREGSRFRTVL